MGGIEWFLSFTLKMWIFGNILHLFSEYFKSCVLCAVDFENITLYVKLGVKKIIYFMNDEVEIFHSRKSKYLVSPISETMAF